MQTETTNKGSLLRAGQILLKVVLFLILFIIVLLLLLFSPPGQKFATQRIENYLEKTLQTKVEIGSISVGLPRKLLLQDVYIEDRTRDTLLSGGSIRADLNIYRLFSNEVLVKELELRDITAKVKRLPPDSVFNFQFIIDAFAVQQTKRPDTAQTAPLKLDVDNLLLNNIRIVYNDVLTGNDMIAHLSSLTAKIDTLNPYNMHYDVPSLVVRGLTGRFYQTTPAVKAEPVSQDLAEAAAPIVMKLSFGRVQLDDIDFDYANNTSAFFTDLNIGHLVADGRNLDLQNRLIHLEALQLDNSQTAIRLGRKAEAKKLEREIEKEVQVQKQQGWVFRIDQARINNNVFAFDNDNSPKQRYGIDYAHMRSDSLTLHVDDFVLKEDSTGGRITRGHFRDQSGFLFEALEGDVLWSHNQAYAKGLHLKTPGTELKRNVIMEYESYDALAKNFPKTLMDLEIVDSRVQVKDILSFAPQLRTHPAFANPSDVWHLNIVGSGNMDRMHFESLQFDGLRNTQIDASGTLAGLTDPNAAGGTFTIRRLHTNQTDLSLFTGQRLSTPDITLPESFDVTGTASGNMQNLSANLNIYTSAGAVAVNGRFTNLANPAAATYNARVRTSSLQLNEIIKAGVPVGAITANMNISGSGFTPNTMNTRFKGVVNAISYNRYTYRNLRLDGTLRRNVFTADIDIRDPNIDLTATASGNLANTSSFRLVADVDSIKTLPLHFTTQPLVFRGRINADVASLNADYLDANVLITDALLVSNGDRLPIDSMHLVSGRNDTAQFIRLTSDIANAELIGQYRFSDLGYIFQNNIQPYFSIASSNRVYNVRPYDFTFRADIENSPFLSVFVPGLQVNQPIHAEGSLATGRGLQAVVTTPSLVYDGNEISDLNVNVTTTPSGLQFTGTISHLRSNTLNIYQTNIRATALNNVINFALDVNDKANKEKYILSGVLRQPSTGTYVLRLNPDSLLLNYERWTVSAGNELILSPTHIGANNFTLSKNGQQLTLQSAGTGNALTATFNNFQIATITGFMQSDSLLVGGAMNGTVTFRDLLQQPLFTSNLTINDLSFKQDTVGNVQLNVSSTAANRYITNATITGRGNDIQITGSMAPQGDDVALDLDLAIRKMELSTMEGALAGAITDATGNINGSVKIAGTMATPDVQGSLNFNDAAFNTVLLGGTFKIDNETLAVTEQGFNFNNFTIRDSANNTLNLNGNVLTTNFINYNFNLDVDADNFQVINTTKKQGSIYYGDMVISSDLHIGGTERSPIIDGAVTINDRTNFTVVVPQPEPGVAQREGIVVFVDMDAPENDSLFRAYDSLNHSALLGYDIAVNIEVKKEAVFNLVLDEANGDFVNVQGEALLSTGIDPSGKVTLTGSYELQRGSYQLSFNFIQRKFDIQPGSKIIWLGEPTRATLDVTGIYIANAAPLDLVEDQIQASNVAIRNTYFMQKLPFEVRLHLTGELLRPQVGFDIVLPERSYLVSRDVIQIVDIRLQQLRQEPSELNKQVFALLLLNRFVGEDPFSSQAGGGLSASNFARQSVSRLLTEQLNRLAGGLVGGVDITFGVTSTDDYTTGEKRTRTDLNVGLSKRLLNDRLTVSVGSNFELEGPQSTQTNNQSASNMIGDISINYQLSKDGRYMLRTYRRNQYEGVVEGYVIESGIAFSINMDYDHFRELLRRKKTKVDGIDDKQNPIQ
jgi:translocation and assembly module TamB